MEKTKKTINIAMITDDNYVMPTLVAIKSMTLNKEKNSAYIINILTNNLSKQNIEKLEAINSKFCTINIVNKGELIEKYQDITQDRHVTYTALLKFFLPSIFKELDKILYLDSDIIVQKDLSELYQTNIDDYYAGVIKDTLTVKNPNHLLTFSCQNKNYFNSGVMLLNLKKMRENDIPNKMINFRLSVKQHFMDQDTFNVIIGENVKFLSYRYNFLNFYLSVMDKKQLSLLFEENLSKYKTDKSIYSSCTIIHLGGKEKPWVYNLGYLSILYKKYYNKTCFSKQKLVLKKTSQNNTLIKNFFSVKNETNKGIKRKVLTILGIKFKFKISNGNQIFIIKNNKRYAVKKIKGLKVKFDGINSILEIYAHPQIKFENSTIIMGNNCYVSIKESKGSITNTLINMQYSTNSTISIGSRFSIISGNILNIRTDSVSINIGNDCMFSANIYIRSSDGHTIYDNTTGEVLNHPKCINIGNHVWLGNGARILKNSTIMDNTIVGNNSLVTKNFTEGNCIIAGVPAKIIKTNVNWDRKAVKDYIIEKGVKGDQG